MKQSKVFPFFAAVLAFMFIMLIVPARVAAVTPSGCVQDCSPPAPGYCLVGGKCQLKNPAPNQLVDLNNFGDLLKRIIETMLFFAGGIATLFLIVGGYRYVTSTGNEEAMEKAKKTVTSAVIGIVIIVMAFAIVAIVNAFLTRDAAQQVSMTLGFMV